MATDDLPLNEDDDLFNFDDMKPDSAQAPIEASKPEGNVAVSIEAKPVATNQAAASKSSAEPARTTPAPAPAIPSREPAAQLPLVKPVVFKQTEERVAPSIAEPPTAKVGRQRLSVLTLLLLVLASLVNIVLIGIVWRSMSGMDKALNEVALRVAHANDSNAGDATKKKAAWQSLVVEAPNSDEGELTLAAAAQEIRHGEYERSRVRVYSLLSVIDRFDAKVRPNLEARAQVLAADSFREQAEAVERESASPAGARGVLDEATEQHR